MNDHATESKETANTHVVNNLENGLLTKPSSPKTNIMSSIQPTHIQSLYASLVHVHTKVELELPSHLEAIYIGKPNEKKPPDIDVSGFPHSQIVSRIHATIIREQDNFYIEDTGSANGTYINHTPLPSGNRHLLKSGDRIALGKEDKVSFIFQLKV
jgi:hypothetical protein